jgi:hypothetical protein
MKRPHERQHDLSGIAALHRCCCLARIAHKYHFQSVETWVLDTLSEFWAEPETGTDMPELVETTNVAFLCGNPRLCELVTRTWMEIVRSAKGPGKILDLSLAIRVAEQRGLSSVIGRAYYAMMILGRNLWEKDGILDRSQHLRLLSGFHDLTLQCSSLPTQPAPIFTHSACKPLYTVSSKSSAEKACESGWPHLWRNLFHQRPLRDAFNTLSPADLVGRLSYVAKHLQQFHDAILASANCPMTPACLKSASIKIRAMSKECMEYMPSLFVDPK